MRIDWSYVAGFFDGEGSISPSGGGQHRIVVGLQVNIAQKPRAVLDAIVAFLNERGITAKVYGPGRTGVHGLRLAKARDVLAFLVAIRPYCIVKKQIVEDAVRHCRLFRPLPCGSLSWENRGAFREGVRISA